MNKSDITITFIIISISLMMMAFLYSSEKSNKAIVYYENKIVKTIDLTIKKEQKFKIKGFNGDVIVIASDGKIKVDKENSPYNLCSKQGFISKSYESIVCLPNKIVVKIVADTNIDTVIR